MPAAVLIVFLLGAISVDAAVRFQAQREAVGDAQAIAHDAVSAISATGLRAPTGPDPDRLDPTTVARRIDEDIHARRLRGTVRWHLANGIVTVIVTRRATLIFSGAVPGGHSTAEVQGTASAALVVQDGR